MKVEIWSDIMCPFCYIGKRNYEKASKRLPIPGRKKGLAVAFFIFNRKYTVSGAQPPEVFLQTLERSFQEWKLNLPSKGLPVLEDYN